MAFKRKATAEEIARYLGGSDAGSQILKPRNSGYSSLVPKKTVTGVFGESKFEYPKYISPSARSMATLVGGANLTDAQKKDWLTAITAGDSSSSRLLETALDPAKTDSMLRNIAGISEDTLPKVPYEKMSEAQKQQYQAMTKNIPNFVGGANKWAASYTDPTRTTIVGSKFAEDDARGELSGVNGAAINALEGLIGTVSAPQTALHGSAQSYAKTPKGKALMKIAQDDYRRLKAEDDLVNKRDRDGKETFASLRSGETSNPWTDQARSFESNKANTFASVVAPIKLTTLGLLGMGKSLMEQGKTAAYAAGISGERPDSAYLDQYGKDVQGNMSRGYDLTNPYNDPYSTAEMLRDVGWKYDKNASPLEKTQRGVATLAGDVFADPANLLAAAPAAEGAERVLKLGSMAVPDASLVDDVGEAIIKTAADDVAKTAYRKGQVKQAQKIINTMDNANQGEKLNELVGVLRTTDMPEGDIRRVVKRAVKMERPTVGSALPSILEDTAPKSGLQGLLNTPIGKPTDWAGKLDTELGKAAKRSGVSLDELKNMDASLLARTENRRLAKDVDKALRQSAPGYSRLGLQVGGLRADVPIIGEALARATTGVGNATGLTTLGRLIGNLDIASRGAGGIEIAQNPIATAAERAILGGYSGRGRQAREAAKMAVSNAREQASGERSAGQKVADVLQIQTPGENLRNAVAVQVRDAMENPENRDYIRILVNDIERGAMSPNEQVVLSSGKYRASDIYDTYMNTHPETGLPLETNVPRGQQYETPLSGWQSPPAAASEFPDIPEMIPEEMPDLPPNSTFTSGGGAAQAPQFEYHGSPVAPWELEGGVLRGSDLANDAEFMLDEPPFRQGLFTGDIGTAGMDWDKGKPNYLYRINTGGMNVSRPADDMAWVGNIIETPSGSIPNNLVEWSDDGGATWNKMASDGGGTKAEWFDNPMNPQTKVVALSRNGVDVGSAEIQKLQDGTPYIRFFTIKPEFRGQGLSPDVLDSLEKSIAQQFPDAERIMLSPAGIDSEFGDMSDYWKKLGYSEGDEISTGGAYTRPDGTTVIKLSGTMHSGDTAGNLSKPIIRGSDKTVTDTATSFGDNAVDTMGGATPKQKPTKSDDTGLSYYNDLIQGKPFHDSRYPTVADYYRQEKGIEATVVEMSPDEYIRLATANMGDRALEMRAQSANVDEYAQRMLAGEKAPTPYVEYGADGSVRGQEGLHRALAAKMAGFDSIDVAVVRPTNSGVADNFFAQNTTNDTAVTTADDATQFTAASSSTPPWIEKVGTEEYSTGDGRFTIMREYRGKAPVSGNVEEKRYASKWVIKDNETGEIHPTAIDGERGLSSRAFAKEMQELGAKAQFREIKEVNPDRVVREVLSTPTGKRLARVLGDDEAQTIIRQHIETIQSLYDDITEEDVIRQTAPDTERDMYQHVASPQDGSGISNAASAVTKKGYNRQNQTQLLGLDNTRVSELQKRIDDLDPELPQNASKTKGEKTADTKIRKRAQSELERVSKRMGAQEARAGRGGITGTLERIAGSKGYEPIEAAKESYEKRWREQVGMPSKAGYMKESEYKTARARRRAGVSVEADPYMAAEERMNQSGVLANQNQMVRDYGSVYGERVTPVLKDGNITGYRREGSEKVIGANADSLIKTANGEEAYIISNADTRNYVKKSLATGGLSEFKGVPGLRRVMPYMTSLMTVMRPAFVAVNTLGNVELVLRDGAADGADVMFATKAIHALSKTNGDLAKLDGTWIEHNGSRVNLGQFMREAERSGAISPTGLNPSMAFDLSRSRGFQKTPLIGAFANFNAKMNSISENTSRLAVYSKAIRNGHNAKSAKQVVDKALFNYDVNALSPFEQNMRSFFPFLTWTRRNVPATAEYFGKYPGRIDELFEAQTALSDWDDETGEPRTFEQVKERQPEWMQNEIAASVGKNAYTLRSPSQQLMSLISGARTIGKGVDQIASGDWQQGVPNALAPLTGFAKQSMAPQFETLNSLIFGGGLDEYGKAVTPASIAKGLPTIGNIPRAIEKSQKPFEKGGDPDAVPKALYNLVSPFPIYGVNQDKEMLNKAIGNQSALAGLIGDLGKMGSYDQTLISPETLPKRERTLPYMDEYKDAKREARREYKKDELDKRLTVKASNTERSVDAAIWNYKNKTGSYSTKLNREAFNILYKSNPSAFKKTVFTSKGYYRYAIYNEFYKELGEGK